MQSFTKHIRWGLLTWCFLAYSSFLSAQHIDYLYDPTFVPPNVVGGDGSPAVGMIYVHDDGRYVVAGSYQFNYPYLISGIARFHPDGSLDNSFNVSGDPSPTSYALPFKEGYLTLSWNRIAYRNFNGGTDPETQNFLAYQQNPHFPPPFSGLPNPSIGGIQIMPGDKVMVTGRFYPDTTDYNDLRHLVRVMPDGTPDYSFEPLKCHDPLDAYLIDLYPTSDGKWMIAGNFNDIEGFVSPNIARLNADFSVDTTFKSPYPNHDWSVRIIPGSDPHILSGAIDEQNRVYVGRIEPGHAYPLLGLKHERLLASGAIDTTFQVGEIFYYNHNYLPPHTPPTYPGSIYCVHIETGGTLIIGGRFRSISGEIRGNIAKINEDGSLIEEVFNRLGADTALWVNSEDIPSVHKITDLPDGGLMVGGCFSRYDGHEQWGLVRLMPSPVGIAENSTNEIPISCFPNLHPISFTLPYKMHHCQLWLQ